MCRPALWKNIRWSMLMRSFPPKNTNSISRTIVHHFTRRKPRKIQRHSYIPLVAWWRRDWTVVTSSLQGRSRNQADVPKHQMVTRKNKIIEIMKKKCLHLLWTHKCHWHSSWSVANQPSVQSSIAGDRISNVGVPPSVISQSWFQELSLCICWEQEKII